MNPSYDNADADTDGTVNRYYYYGATKRRHCTVLDGLMARQDLGSSGGVASASRVLSSRTGPFRVPPPFVGRFDPSCLASLVAWNPSRMQNMILAVGPGTPASVVSWQSPADDTDHDDEDDVVFSSSSSSSSDDDDDAMAHALLQQAVNEEDEDDQDEEVEDQVMQQENDDGEVEGENEEEEEEDAEDMHTSDTTNNTEDASPNRTATNTTATTRTTTAGRLSSAGSRILRIPTRAARHILRIRGRSAQEQALRMIRRRLQEQQQQQQDDNDDDDEDDAMLPPPPPPRHVIPSPRLRQQQRRRARHHNHHHHAWVPSMRHGGCINTACWLDCPWRLSTVRCESQASFSSNGGGSHVPGIVEEFEPDSLYGTTCRTAPTQCATSGDDRLVKFWDVRAAMGTANPVAGGWDTFSPFAHYGGGNSFAPVRNAAWKRQYQKRYCSNSSSGNNKNTSVPGSVLPLATLATGHRGNVFHVTPVHANPGQVLTCGADGYLRLGDVVQETSRVVVHPYQDRQGNHEDDVLSSSFIFHSGMAFSHVMVSANTGLLCSERGLHAFDVRVAPGQQPTRSILQGSSLSPPPPSQQHQQRARRDNTRVHDSDDNDNDDEDSFSVGSSSDAGGGGSSWQSMSCKACAVWSPPGRRQATGSTASANESDDYSSGMMDAHLVFAGGSCPYVGLYDLRMQNRIVQRYKPKRFLQPPPQRQSNGYHHHHGRSNVSVSGLDVSGDGREVLVSYESDLIYSFPTFPRCSTGIPTYSDLDRAATAASKTCTNDQEETKKRNNNSNSNMALSSSSSSLSSSSSDDSQHRDAAGGRGGGVISELSVYGGHLNRFTFLKNAKYAGPNSQYICTGSDSGHAWIYQRNTGTVAAFLSADSSTCNGVIPHPTLPLFLTYGIDSTAKLWRATTPVQGGGNHGDHHRDGDDENDDRTTTSVVVDDSPSGRYRASCCSQQGAYQELSPVTKSWNGVQALLRHFDPKKKNDGDKKKDDDDDDDDSSNASSSRDGCLSSTDPPVLVFPDFIASSEEIAHSGHFSSPCRRGMVGGYYHPASGTGASRSSGGTRRGGGGALSSSSAASAPPRIGNALRTLPAVLRQNRYECCKTLRDGLDVPVEPESLPCVSVATALARLSHQAQRLGLSHDYYHYYYCSHTASDKRPWNMIQSEPPEQSNDEEEEEDDGEDEAESTASMVISRSGSGGSSIKGKNSNNPKPFRSPQDAHPSIHPADLVPDFPSDWLVLDANMIGDRAAIPPLFNWNTTDYPDAAADAVGVVVGVREEEEEEEEKARRQTSGEQRQRKLQNGGGGDDDDDDDDSDTDTDIAMTGEPDNADGNADDTKKPPSPSSNRGTDSNSNSDSNDIDVEVFVPWLDPRRLEEHNVHHDESVTAAEWPALLQQEDGTWCYITNDNNDDSNKDNNDAATTTTTTTTARASAFRRRRRQVLYETALLLKEGGNQAVKHGQLQLAARRYDKAIQYCAVVLMKYQSTATALTGNTAAAATKSDADKDTQQQQYKDKSSSGSGNEHGKKNHHHTDAINRLSPLEQLVAGNHWIPPAPPNNHHNHNNRHYHHSRHPLYFYGSNSSNHGSASGPKRGPLPVLVTWSPLLQVLITTRLNLALLYLKPSMGLPVQAAEQARAALTMLAPFCTIPHKIVAHTKPQQHGKNHHHSILHSACGAGKKAASAHTVVVVDHSKRPDRHYIWQEAVALQAKAYFRLGSAELEAGDYAASINSLEASIQASAAICGGASGASSSSSCCRTNNNNKKPDAVVVRRLQLAKRKHKNKKKRDRQKFQQMLNARDDDDDDEEEDDNNDDEEEEEEDEEEEEGGEKQQRVVQQAAKTSKEGATKEEVTA